MQKSLRKLAAAIIAVVMLCNMGLVLAHETVQDNEELIRVQPGYKKVLVAVVVWVTVMVPVVVIETREVFNKVTQQWEKVKVEVKKMTPEKRKEIRYEERWVPIDADYVNAHDNVEYSPHTGNPVFVPGDNYWNNLKTLNSHGHLH